MENSVARVREELQSKHVYVPNQWLQALAGEQADGESFNFAFCFKKWLDTNLLELDYSNVQIPDQLPDYSLTRQAYPINATFQIVQVQDVAQPVPNDYCEELYQKKANDYELNDDDEVTGFIENAEPRNGPVENAGQANADNRPVNQSKNRHLLLKLYNGKKLFKALEYQPINQLNFGNCYPGAKVSIRGDVLLSLGVILLKPRNIAPFGGCRLVSVENENNSRNVEMQENSAPPPNDPNRGNS